jgi:ribosome-associated translation inhibitor RaiA
MMKMRDLVNIISKGDTKTAEALFSKPGGRKYLENIVLVTLTTLPCSQEEKEESFMAFRSILNKIETRIRRQKQGQKILQQVFIND